jgi:hypothetical protein
MHKKDPKLSLEEVKSIPINTLSKMIDKAKSYLKKDETMKNIFEEYGEDVDIIDYIPTYFDDLDVSAKTDHGIVIINYKLLCDGDFFKDYSYLIHEYTHWAQQCLGEKPTKSSDDGDYLNNKFEQEGFQNQVEYISNHFGEEEAEKYVKHLLDHHEVTEKKEKDKLKAIFLENA